MEPVKRIVNNVVLSELVHPMICCSEVLYKRSLKSDRVLRRDYNQGCQ